MRVVVGTTPAQLDVELWHSPVIQNLGPGVIYMDFDPAVSATSGFQLPVGAVYEFARDVSKALYMVATAASTDVRVLVVG